MTTPINNPTPAEPAETVRVVARVSILGVGVAARPGEPVDLPAEKAAELIEKGYAKPAEDQ